MSLAKARPFLLAIAVAMVSTHGNAYDCKRVFRQLRGWTIQDSNWVQESRASRSGDRTVLLSNGQAYEVMGLILEPMAMDEAVLFSRSIGKGFLVKILIDGEVYDAFPTKWR